MRRFALAAAILLGVSACGGGGSPSTPTPQPQPQPQPQANRAPAVTSVTATPTFGVQDFGQFTFNASATDADGDPLTYTWDLAGNARTGQTVQIGPFINGFNGRATVTIAD